MKIHLIDVSELYICLLILTFSKKYNILIELC